MTYERRAAPHLRGPILATTLIMGGVLALSGCVEELVPTTQLWSCQSQRDCADGFGCIPSATPDAFLCQRLDNTTRGCTPDVENRCQAQGLECLSIPGLSGNWCGGAWFSDDPEPCEPTCGEGERCVSGQCVSTGGCVEPGITLTLGASAACPRNVFGTLTNNSSTTAIRCDIEGEVIGKQIETGSAFTWSSAHPDGADLTASASCTCAEEGREEERYQLETEPLAVSCGAEGDCRVESLAVTESGEFVIRTKGCSDGPITAQVRSQGMGCQLLEGQLNAEEAVLTTEVPSFQDVIPYMVSFQGAAQGAARVHTITPAIGGLSDGPVTTLPKSRDVDVTHVWQPAETNLAITGPEGTYVLQRNGNRWDEVGSDVLSGNRIASGIFTCGEGGILLTDMGFYEGLFELFELASDITAIELGDLNADGVLDAVISRADGELYTVDAMLSKGDGSWETQVITRSPASDIAVGDIDGDYLQDVIAFSPAVGLETVALNNGDGRSWRLLTPGTALRPVDVAIARHPEWPVPHILTLDEIGMIAAWRFSEGTFQRIFDVPGADYPVALRVLPADNQGWHVFQLSRDRLTVYALTETDNSILADRTIDSVDATAFELIGTGGRFEVYVTTGSGNVSFLVDGL